LLVWVSSGEPRFAIVRRSRELDLHQPKKSRRMSQFGLAKPAESSRQAQGVPAQCVGAPLRASWKTSWLGPFSFWTSCGIYLKGARVGYVFLWAPRTSGGFRKSILSETAGAGSRLNAKRLHRWGRPFWGPTAPRPVRTSGTRCGSIPRLGAGSLERRPARVLATPGTDGSRNRRTPRVTRGRQPERACSGPSG
jgi:hypothetical protein